MGRNLWPVAAGDEKKPSLTAVGVHFSFAFLGVSLYVVSLSIAGTMQGITWASGNPFIVSVENAAPFWLARAVAGTMMFVAHVVFAYNV